MRANVVLVLYGSQRGSFGVTVRVYNRGRRRIGATVVGPLFGDRRIHLGSLMGSRGSLWGLQQWSQAWALGVTRSFGPPLRRTGGVAFGVTSGISDYDQELWGHCSRIKDTLSDVSARRWEAL